MNKLKVTIIAEGSYPYITGGVSSWINTLIKNIPSIDFEVLSIMPNMDNEIKYEYHDNYQGTNTLYFSYDINTSKMYRIPKEVLSEIKSLFTDDETNFDIIYEYFVTYTSKDVAGIVQSRDYFNLMMELYKEQFINSGFNNFVWAFRSMLVPLFNVLANPVTESDVYHTVSTGYAGIVASKHKYFTGKPVYLTEHGIYTRERESEIVKSNWIISDYKNLWITFFRKLSGEIYSRADKVMTLFEKNKNLQLELGCPELKLTVVPNGVSIERFEGGKANYSTKYIDVGAIVRVVPIKDIVTLIHAFKKAKEKVENLRLFIIGPTDENEEYFELCKEIIEKEEVTDVIFTGKVNIMDYIYNMRFFVLSSISEGQPLVILEGFAAKKAFVSTNVGSCYELIYGEEGEAGIIVPVMHSQKLANAIVKLAMDSELTEKMGEAGYRRVQKDYRLEQLIQFYEGLYKGDLWLE